MLCGPAGACRTFALSATTNANDVKVTAFLSVPGAGDFTVRFCTSTAECQSSTHFCAIIMCIRIDVFGDVIKAITNIYNKVSVVPPFSLAWL